MLKSTLVIILSIAIRCVYATDIFSLQVVEAHKLSTDSLFFNIIDQQRVIQNDGIIKLDIAHLPSGYREQKIAWMQEGVCTQYVTYKGIGSGKIFIRASTTIAGIENSKSAFLLFINQGKVLSVQHLYDSSLASLGVEVESGELLAGFSNKIAISTLNNKTGKPQKEQVTIFTDGGDTLSRFTVAGKRLIDLYVEPGKNYFLQTGSAQPLPLKSSSYGYGIKCKQAGDSIDIEIYRARQQPVEQLYFCLQVNSKLDTIASFTFDDTLFVMNTRFYWPPLRSNQYIGFVLLNDSNVTLARRYWEPDDGLVIQSPFFTKLNTNKINIDRSFDMRFSCKGCDRERITFQLTNSNNELSGIGQVNWISDTVFTITNLQLVGKGYLALNVDRDNINWKPIIQSIPIAVEKPAAIFYAKEDAIQAVADNISAVNNTYVPNNANLLPDVSVTGIKKTRIEELEEKYVNNIMFKSLFSVSINVLDDENSRNGLTLLNYISQKLPITQLKNIRTERNREALYHRGGEVEYWVDEVPYRGALGADIANSIFPGDVAYVKLIKTPIRGLGAFGSNLLIYTKKGNEKELDKRFSQRVSIEGIHILE